MPWSKRGAKLQSGEVPGRRIGAENRLNGRDHCLQTAPHCGEEEKATAPWSSSILAVITQEVSPGAETGTGYMSLLKRMSDV